MIGTIYAIRDTKIIIVMIVEFQNSSILYEVTFVRTKKKERVGVTLYQNILHYVKAIRIRGKNNSL